MTRTSPREFNIDAPLLSSVFLLGAFRQDAWADDGPPEVVTLTGVVRDFQEQHPDMEVTPDRGYGLYCGNVALLLGDDGNPVFTGEGNKVTEDYRDSQGRPIARHLCNRRFVDTDDGVALADDPSLGDQAGTSSYSSAGGVTSADTFAQWFTDELGVNMSKPLQITLERQEDGTYVFDSDTDPTYQALGGFFPIEDDLFGNPGGYPDRNFHFTFELHTSFTYDAGGEQFFRFTGDDDVWVFIDGKLAIDLGGVHATKDQWIDLSRLGLTDGETYTMDLFFAERHRTESNFRVHTNIPFEETPPTGMPSMTAAFD